MSVVDDITKAIQDAAKTGAAAASTAGRDLTQDIEQFVIPHLRDIAIQVAGIVEKRLAGIFTDATAKALLHSQQDAIQTIIETMVSLAALEAQTIINAVVSALNTAVNTALGFALLA